MTTGSLFGGIPDRLVMEQAASHLRNGEYARFRAAMAELDRRLVARTLARLAGHEPSALPCTPGRGDLPPASSRAV